MVRCGAGVVGVRRRAAIAMIAVAMSVVVLAGCSTGADAVVQGGTVEFVSPGGKTDIFYDPPQQRGTVGAISGPDLMIDAKVTYPSIFDPEIRTAIALGRGYPTSVVPTTLVLDRQHRVAAVFLRALLAEDLQPVVARVAAER